MATWAGDGQTPVRIFISDGTNWLEANAAMSDGIQWSGLTPYVNPTASYSYSEAIFSITSNLTQNIWFTQSDAYGVTVDWGDGSQMETYQDLSVHASHTYDESGDYIVRFSAATGVTWSPGATIQSVNSNNETVTTVYGFLGQFGVSHGFKDDYISSYPTLRAFRFGSGARMDQPKSFAGASSLTEIILPNGITTVPSHALAGCLNLRSITIPDTVTIVGDHAFYKCQYFDFASIIPQLTTIGDYAFSHCSGVAGYMELRATSVGHNAFEYCTGLRRVWLRDTVATLSVTVKTDTNQSSQTYGSVKEYIGPFYNCDETLILYAECYEVDKPVGWDDHFNAHSGTTKVYLVIWHQTTAPVPSLVFMWNAHGRLLTMTDIADLEDGYDYDPTEKQLTIY